MISHWSLKLGRRFEMIRQQVCESLSIQRAAFRKLQYERRKLDRPREDPSWCFRWRASREGAARRNRTKGEDEVRKGFEGCPLLLIEPLGTDERYCPSTSVEGPSSVNPCSATKASRKTNLDELRCPRREMPTKRFQRRSNDCSKRTSQFEIQSGERSIKNARSCFFATLKASEESSSIESEVR